MRWLDGVKVIVVVLGISSACVGQAAAEYGLAGSNSAAVTTRTGTALNNVMNAAGKKLAGAVGAQTGGAGAQPRTTVVRPSATGPKTMSAAAKKTATASATATKGAGPAGGQGGEMKLTIVGASEPATSAKSKKTQAQKSSPRVIVLGGNQ